MNNLHALILNLQNVAELSKYQLEIINVEDDSDDLIVKFTPAESPPALSVHVSDGVGSKDKVGG